WFDGPLALAGAISTGNNILATEVMGADFAYIGSPFIATHEARSVAEYKQDIVEGNAEDIVYSNYFTGVHGNYLASSIRASGLDPQNLLESAPLKMDFVGNDAQKAWKEIRCCVQIIDPLQYVQ